MNLQFQLHEYSYFPYELMLAKLEVERVVGASPVSVPGGLKARVGRLDRSNLSRLTYFREIEAETGEPVRPLQALLEASANGLSGNPRRQSTRYSAHGLHEYRGKFNPQIVRATANILGLPEGARIWDPFCGSGTVLLESLHCGFDAFGSDLNPLAIEIANAKVAALRASRDTLTRAADELASYLQEKSANLSYERAFTPAESRRVMRQDWREVLPNVDYLARWFPESVLVQVASILDGLAEKSPRHLRAVFRVALSDIVRGVSWQDDGDLRTRRRKTQADNYPAIPTYCASLAKKVHSIVAAKAHLPTRKARQMAVVADSGDMTTYPQPLRSFLADKIDCVISSPPYATALPYIDTQRLSIALLGMASAARIRSLDSELVGSREIANSERLTLEGEMEEHGNGLPTSVSKFCRKLLRAVDALSDGFRRQNTPSLIYRYCQGMRRAMKNAFDALKKHGCLAFVVGPSRTTLGGHCYRIDTPSLLRDIGVSVGFEDGGFLRLDAYRRYDVHSKNSIREESLLILHKP